MKITKDKFLNDVEFSRTLNLCHQHRADRDSLLIRFGLYSGARECEFLAVTKADLSANGTVYIRGAKNSNDRIVPLPKDFFRELQKHAVDFQPGDRLFPMTERRFRQVWEYWRPSGKGGHSLRHTFAIRLYKNCRDIKVVQVALGHKNIKNTLVYLDFVEGQEQMEKATQGMWDIQVA